MAESALKRHFPQEYQSSNQGETQQHQGLEWYVKDLTSLKKEARDVFENYSKVDPDRVVPHVVQFVSNHSRGF